MTDMTPTFYVVTPCLNTRDTIDRTILSVVTQTGNFRIRYHIQDGGSTDGNWERILWWKRRLAAKAFPISFRGLEFSCAQEEDLGMYDAIIRGYDQMYIREDQFMTWINADDILMPGAFSLVANVCRQFSLNQVSWLGGCANVIRDGVSIVNYDRVLPTEVVRAGLCDGINWDFVQQEGTFYRKWLWSSANPSDTIRTMKVGGDWNLWRLFARKASLVQSGSQLGGFTIRAGQLSAKFRDKYNSEMDEIVSLESRREALKALGAKGEVYRRRLKIAYSDGLMSVVDENKFQDVVWRYKKAFGAAPANAKTGVPAEKPVYQGVKQPAVAESEIVFDETFTLSDNIAAFDAYWQFPAITEHVAYKKVVEHIKVPDGIVYVAYPWATLIDKLQNKTRDSDSFLDHFREFCARLPPNAVKITVCQQIFMRRHMHLLEMAGISHVFWTHAVHDDVTAGTRVHPAVHPFPLYPVQVTETTEGATPESDDVKRPYLFSFVGARANQWNLTESRNWIIDILGGDERGLVVGRDGWHYQKIVYDHQVRGISKDATELVDHDASRQFKMMLEQSTFSLCPSGSGPNSIRLWESLGAGSIPVILADTWAPPGNPKLWEAAAVFCKETPEAVKALPDRLEEMAADPQKLAAMRQATRQLWLLYGPQCFVHDIHKLMIDLGNVVDKGSSKSDFLTTIMTRLLEQQSLSRQDATSLLRASAGRLLMDGVNILREFDEDRPLGELIVAAKSVLTEADTTHAHFDHVLSHVVEHKSRPTATIVRINVGGAPRVCLFGNHSHRTPFSYEPFRKLIGNRVAFVDRIEAADLVVTGFNRDFNDNADALVAAAKLRHTQKRLVLSEEPLWDVHWSGGFVERDRKLGGKGENLPYTFLNHQNSEIFAFKIYPYFPLTTDDFAPTYSGLIARFSQLSAAELLEHWEKAPIQAAFFAEFREGDTYNKSFPELDARGLCTFRTGVTKNFDGQNVVKAGKGWQGDARRQDLPDWHLDKLATLHKRVRVLSALENTHQRQYISEKIFDAFAVGGIPVYFASPNHRVLEWVPTASMINVFDLTVDAAVTRIKDFKPDLTFAESWLETAKNLQARFADVTAIHAERQRIADECVREITNLF